MDKTYEKLLRSGIDLSPVGVERRVENTPYFCTPKGAAIFGWAGVDGIHFCFIRGFGGMVFAVSPMNAAPEYVHPLAKDFADFLRLLLACGDAAAPEQAWMWDEAQFAAFLRENPPTPEQQTCMSEIAEEMKLLPMEQPWAYIREVQSSFDYGRLRYSKEFHNPDRSAPVEIPVPAWEVCYEGGFSGHRRRTRAKAELRLDQQLDWAGHHWNIPAAYPCGKGLVVDFCMRVEAERIRQFAKKWDANAEYLTQEQQMQMELENPFCLDFSPQLTLNGNLMRPSYGCGAPFHPCPPMETCNAPEAEGVVRHYDLDASCGWMLFRYSFPWADRRPREIRTLSLRLEQQPVRVPGPHFKVRTPGDTVAITHPISGTAYTLTVQSLEMRTLPQNRVGADRWVCPSHFVVLRYTISPEPAANISICDCFEGDRLRKNAPDADFFALEARDDAACIGIIGGMDSPTAIVPGGCAQDGYHTSCSSLYFEAVRNDIEWRAEFSSIPFPAMDFSLL